MKPVRFAPVLLLLFMVAPGVVAAAPETRTKANYLGIDVSAVDFGGNEEADGVVIKLGRDIGNFFGIEVHGGVGDAVELNGRDLYEMSQFVSVLGRFNLHFRYITLYAVGGYTVAKFEDYINSTVIDSNETGFAFGAGGMFFFSPNFALNASVIRYLHNSDLEATALNVGFTRYFDWPRLFPRY